MKKIILLTGLIFIYLAGFSSGWTGKPSFAIHSTSAFFTIRDSGFIVAGSNAPFSYLHDTWTYHAGAWTQIANYPNTTSDEFPVGFALGDSGFVGTGVGSGYVYTNAFYKYHNGAWTSIAPFPGAARYAAVAFVIGDTAYVGGGCDRFNNYIDFYKYYDGVWKRIADCPAAGVSFKAAAFSIGDTGYVGTGSDLTTSAIHQDFWKYDPSHNVWKQIADYGGGTRMAAAAFSICNKGYLGTGYSDLARTMVPTDFWQYTPATGTWTEIANFPGVGRNSASAFVIGDSAFVGGGTGATWPGFTDYWSYTSTPLVNIAPSTLCKGSPITMKVSGGTTYDWVGNANTTDTININPTKDTTYELLVDQSICPLDTIIKVTVSPLPTADITGITAICSGTNTTLTAKGGATYSWTGGITSTSSSISVSPLSNATYSLAISSGGCSKDTTVNVVVTQTPIPTISAPQTICFGNSVSLTAGGGTSYSWAPDSGLSSTTIADPSANPAKTITYTVTVANGACTATDNVVVTVNPPPSVNAFGTAAITVGESTGLGVSPVNTGDLYNWVPATTLSCNTCANPIATPGTTTIYTLTVTDNSGCNVSDTVSVKVNEQCGSIYMPTAFSPNGDGSNDVLSVMGNCIRSLDMMIFDRWGNKVFETTNPSAVWDGTFKGKPMNTGTYVYSVTITDFTNTIISKKGNVTLLR